MSTANDNPVPRLLIFGLMVYVLALIFSDGSKNAVSNHSASENFTSGSAHSTPLIDGDYDEGIGGYEWAEENGAESFSDCDGQFGSGTTEEDECNQYVQDNGYYETDFHGYDCTEDCSGHEAGYEWAEENDISDEYDCDGNSNSFNEGCQAYIEENY